MALKTFRKSRKIALSVYRNFVKGKRIIYFCPDRDILLFAGLVKVFWMLSRTRERPGLVTQLLANTFDHEASQLMDQLAHSSTIKWLSILENTTSYVMRRGRPIMTYRLPPPRSRSILSELLRQASTSHYRVKFNVRDAFLERYELTPYYRKGVKRRKRSGKVRGIWG
jgi:hypothetical protein